METINNIKFDTSIRVLFKIKEAKGHKTLQETYKFLGNPEIEIDTILDVIKISYGIANKDDNVDDEKMQEVLAINGVGFGKIAMIYQKIIEKIMFDGLTEEERKNMIAQAEKAQKK